MQPLGLYTRYSYIQCGNIPTATRTGKHHMYTEKRPGMENRRVGEGYRIHSPGASSDDAPLNPYTHDKQ